MRWLETILGATRRGRSFIQDGVLVCTGPTRVNNKPKLACFWTVKGIIQRTFKLQYIYTRWPRDTSLIRSKTALLRQFTRTLIAFSQLKIPKNQLSRSSCPEIYY